MKRRGSDLKWFFDRSLKWFKGLMTRIFERRPAIKLNWMGRVIMLPLFAIGPQLCRVQFKKVKL